MAADSVQIGTIKSIIKFIAILRTGVNGVWQG
jgi:hypothetical protein